MIQGFILAALLILLITMLAAFALLVVAAVRIAGQEIDGRAWCKEHGLVYHEHVHHFHGKRHTHWWGEDVEGNHYVPDHSSPSHKPIHSGRAK